jgi:hypothetical protein
MIVHICSVAVLLASLSAEAFAPSASFGVRTKVRVVMSQEDLAVVVFCEASKGGTRDKLNNLTREDMFEA